MRQKCEFEVSSLVIQLTEGSKNKNTLSFGFRKKVSKDFDSSIVLSMNLQKYFLWLNKIKISWKGKLSSFQWCSITFKEIYKKMFWSVSKTYYTTSKYSNEYVILLPIWVCSNGIGIWVCLYYHANIKAEVVKSLKIIFVKIKCMFYNKIIDYLPCLPDDHVQWLGQ